MSLMCNYSVYIVYIVYIYIYIYITLNSMYSNNVLIMILYTDSVQGLPNVQNMVYWLQMKHTIM